MASKEKSQNLNNVEQTIRELSDRIVAAQNPIRVLDAIKWTDDIKNDFFKHKFQKLPKVNEEYYKHIPLGFDPEKKVEEFYNIEHDIKRKLGKYNAASRLMQNRCREYRDVVQMLQVRGQRKFTEIAQDLYGSSDDAFYAGAPTLRDLASLVSSDLENIQDKTITEKDKTIYTAQEGVDILTKKLSSYFYDGDKIYVKVSDNIISDASAGADTIKLRADLKFSERVLQLYEVHEGWVHLGTT